ncbi:hypothetical protein CDAR_49701 [Caerostris darwini]|uniref:Uncharacterized protein n=1 Tax=Caerostris darwini TaxID=1538125 RepID=A0AAV4T344_9ARAC|nr:hypothetical protein CDAR_49701 [Caerostris darwini]
MSCVSHSGLSRVRCLRRWRIMEGDRASDVEHSWGSESTMQLKGYARTDLAVLVSEEAVEKVSESWEGFVSVTTKQEEYEGRTRIKTRRVMHRRKISLFGLQGGVLWVKHVLRVTFGAVPCPLFEKVADQGR